MTDIKENKILKIDDQKDQRGVCYISNVPPQMPISKIRELLQPYGIERVYFKSKGSGNNRSYSEGWVEFKDKKIAKMAALSLNGTNIIQKKHKQLSDYMWSIKYLSGFKWDDLNDNFNYERRLSKKKLDLEINQSKKEHEFYLEKTIKKVKQQ
ncbi:unnamed protein product [Paramecium sonneborni]|uniref:RRM domain-containing protein n=1 Tax=Paramecium sonneborni TaxID=65129 RepID=A0A8S1Q326_9CILI|nr:unnamed protein product [Paramecium sonneborni]